jgi:deazaflavin-dependent oxidoreductase (nitroreductase family)
VGRKSGLPRQVVLEVVKHEPMTDIYTVASGFGSTSDWYRNLQSRQDVTIQVRRRKMAVTAHFLTQGEGGEVMMDYAHRYPKAALALSKTLGYPVGNGTPEDYRRVGEGIPFVAFWPK